MSLKGDERKPTVLCCLFRTADIQYVLSQAEKNSTYLEIRQHDMYLILTDMDFLRVVYLGRTFQDNAPLGRVNVFRGATTSKYVLVEQPFDLLDSYVIRESLTSTGLSMFLQPVPMPFQEVQHHAINHPYGPFAGIIALVDGNGKMLVIDPGGYGGDCVKPILLYDGPHRFRPGTGGGDLLENLGNRVVFVDEINVDKILAEAKKRNKSIKPGIERFCNCWSILWYTPGGSFRAHADATEMLLTLIAEMYNVPDLLKPVEALFARLAKVK